MTEHLHCDECGDTVKPTVARGWFALDSLLDTYQPMHFCSWKCLAQYAREEAA